MKFPTHVSDNGRFLLCENGEPFFYLADTAWELFHRLDREETELYLKTRAAQGFTVIQAVLLAELDGLRVPNRAGDVPLYDIDPTRPNEAYFEHVDWVLERASQYGLCVGLLPTWGDKWNIDQGKGPVVFTPENAAVYGEWLGARYAKSSLIWIVGGDRKVENAEQRAVVENMALGLRKGDGGSHLITFHPSGQQTSSQYFHQSEWLDFNMFQTGHKRGRDNYRSIAADYALTPIKPCLDGEPGYENHPSDWKVEDGYLEAIDVRRSLYWALFAGACGHTYGCHEIWQFWQPGRDPISWARIDWREALQLEGATQMHHARTLLESHAFLSRIPDQSLVVGENSDGPEHIQTTRNQNGDYALIYFATGQPATIDLTKLSGQLLNGSWFNPRTGETHFVGEFSTREALPFIPPTVGMTQDWVLVLEVIEKQG